MRLFALPILAWIGAGTTALAATTPITVATYHDNENRSGLYTVPGLTTTVAATASLVKGFAGTVHGHVYAQPLYWQSSSTAKGRIIVATEANQVYALDATSGGVVWHTSLGTPVQDSSLPCGNLQPDGVTGTPVIDPATATLYVASMNVEPAGPQHLVYALSLANGAVETGWPINVRKAATKLGHSFNPLVENQRSALSFVDGTLYVTYGGHYGDCGDYHGWIAAFDPATPALTALWATRAQGGGIWAPGGMAYDGTSLYAATGNTIGASTWGDGEAIVRVLPKLAHAANSDTTDYFAAGNWETLDQEDLDIGGTGPVPVNVPAASGTAALLLGLGKDGNAYLLNRERLGGIGGALIVKQVSTGEIRTAPAVYASGQAAFVAFQGDGSNCPSGSGQGLTALRIIDDPSLAVATAWCANLNGAGAPIVTTTNGSSDPVVWATGAEGDNLLHAYNGTTGAALFSGGQMQKLRHFGTILAAAGRLYVPADGRIYAFGFKGL